MVTALMPSQTSLEWTDPQLWMLSTIGSTQLASLNMPSTPRTANEPTFQKLPTGGTGDDVPLHVRAAKFIADFESFSQHPYMDPIGVWTIGYGEALCDPDGKQYRGPECEAQVRETFKSLPREEGFKRLLEKVAVLLDAIDKAVAVNLTDNELIALASLSYNIGLGAFRTSTLLSLLNHNHKKLASNEFLRWVHADGRRLQGLVNRRYRERAVFDGRAYV